MREFVTAEETVLFCKALSSKLRMDILQAIYQQKGITLGDLAAKMGVSRAAITQNTQILVEADLIEMKTEAGKRGTQKNCFLKEDRFVIALDQHFNAANMYVETIPIGQYTTYRAIPTCGIATTEHMIGVEDDPRYFDAPERTQAGILWLAEGYVTYRLPNYLEENQRITEIQLSFEIGSEAPGIANVWPSDIHFYFNGTHLGYWTSPGDFGDIPGTYTPSWWLPNWNQFGLLKLLSINQRGTFIDGSMISDVTLNDLNLDYQSEMKFKLMVGETGNVGGMTLYGKGFGNYNQDLKLRVVYEIDK